MILKKFPDKQQFIELSQKNNVVPLCTEILADTETPVSILQKFYQKGKPLFLLESVEGGECWARYSFLGISANSHIRVFAKDIERFRWFSNDHIALNPENKNQIIDIRYSMIPNQVQPLWGISLTPKDQNLHAQFKTFRNINQKKKDLYLNMLFK